MEPQYTKVVKSLIKDMIDEYADKIKELQRKLANYKIVWEGPFNMAEPLPMNKADPITKKTGVYQIVYKPSKIIYYVGKGVISDRRHKHRMVFKNAGNVYWANGCKTDSVVARKMYPKDSDLSNWEFWYTRIPEADVMSIFEEDLIQRIEPKFNSLAMAGKG